MLQSFSIVDINTDFVDSKIDIIASFDIDPDTVNDGTIQLFSKHDMNNVNLDFEVNRKTITLYIKNEIVPNTDYILRVTNVKNLVGEPLPVGIRRKITFFSAVKEIPVIMSPSEYEEVKDLKVVLNTLKESNEDVQLEDKLYFIQIASDVAFYNIVMETQTDTETTNFKDLQAGQYYIRARVEIIKDGKKEIGKWSEIVTFISVNFDSCICDDNEPEYIEPVTLISVPVNGETPETILLEFSSDIDPDTIDDIIIIRRDI